MGQYFFNYHFSTVNYSGSRESWDPKFVPFCNEQKSLQILVKHIYNVRKSVPAACFTFNFCLGAPAISALARLRRVISLFPPPLVHLRRAIPFIFPPMVRLWHDIPFIFRPWLKKIQQMQNSPFFFQPNYDIWTVGWTGKWKRSFFFTRIIINSGRAGGGEKKMGQNHYFFSC